MKKIVIMLLAIIMHFQFIAAGTITVTNLMSQQATVTIDTEKKTYAIQVNPSENLNVQKNLDNGINQYDNPLPKVNFDNSGIKKITIKRMQSDLPQIIYYNDEVVTDRTNKPSGIYAINLSKSGTMKIDQDGVDLNGIVYSLNDVSSFYAKCKKLKDMLTSKKPDFKMIEQGVNDLAQSLRLFESSDKAASLSLQLAVTRLEVDYLVNKLQIINQIKEYAQSLQSITQSLTATNVDAVASKLNNMIIGLQTVEQIQLPDTIDIKKIKKNINTLQEKIATIQHAIKATDRPMLVNQ